MSEAVKGSWCWFMAFGIAVGGGHGFLMVVVPSDGHCGGGVTDGGLQQTMMAVETIRVVRKMENPTVAAACFFHLRWTLVVDEGEDGDDGM